MNDFGLDLAVIGNGRTAALVDPSSRIVWWCYPRFDGDPIFSRLLAGGEEKGFCDVVLQGMVDFSSEYVRNTAIVSTVLKDDKGASIRITDFAPRFREYDRIFRPPQLMRIIEPVADQAWNEKRGAFTAAIGIDDLDASVLLLPEIGLMETRDPRFVRTVEAIERELLRDKHVMRYASEDEHLACLLAPSEIPQHADPPEPAHGKGRFRQTH
jgi:GH15 family glucan-1,4-alpha-glucosidase